MLQNLDRLKVFYYVFAQGSVIAAAKTLHVSQSAVSQAIQKLESETKTPMFIRRHKQLIPTAAGERLYSIVQPFMRELDICLRAFEQAKDHPAGELRIGAPVEFGKACLLPIVADFIEQYKDVTFVLHFEYLETLLPLLRKGQIDFALVDMFLTKSTFIGNLDMYHFEPVVEEEIILACSRQYYENYLQNDLSFTSLSQQNFISYKKDLQTIKQWFKHHFSKPNVQVSTSLTVNNHEAIITAIKHHIGMGIIASHHVKGELHRGEIIRIKTDNLEIINPISLIQLQDKIPTFTEKAFERFLVERIKVMDFQIQEKDE